MTLLGVSMPELNRLVKNIEQQYSAFDLPKKDGGIRTVYKPSPELKRIQKSLYKYVRWVERPVWLNSGEMGKSILDNVLPHEKSTNMLKLDISGFFDNCSRESVYQFFKTKLMQTSDVAKICTDLCTLDDAVVQGSSMSMVIAFYANQNMLEELYQLSKTYNLIFTVYVDDITFSSTELFDKNDVLTQATRIINAYGFRVKNKKVHMYEDGQPRKLTGVIINKDNNLRVPNTNRQKILRLTTNYRNAKNDKLSKKYRHSLLGMIGAASQIEPNIFESLRRQLLSDERKES